MLGTVARSAARAPLLQQRRESVDSQRADDRAAAAEAMRLDPEGRGVGGSGGGAHEPGRLLGGPTEPFPELAKGGGIPVVEEVAELGDDLEVDGRAGRDRRVWW